MHGASLYNKCQSLPAASLKLFKASVSLIMDMKLLVFNVSFSSTYEQPMDPGACQALYKPF